MKYIALFLLLTGFCFAQTGGGTSYGEINVVVDISLQTDSVLLVNIPARAIVTHVITVIDSTVTASKVAVTMRETQDTLLSFVPGELDIIGSHHSTSPDSKAGEPRDAVVLHYTTGDAATGRIRVYLKYVELY